MALALPIASQLHASAGITALGVMLTGGANLIFALGCVLKVTAFTAMCDGRTHDLSAVTVSGTWAQVSNAHCC